MLHKTTADVAVSSQSVEDGEVESVTPDYVKTCLQLLYQILYHAVFALTLNQ